MIKVLRGLNNDSKLFESGSKYLECVVKEIEELAIYPRLNSYRDVVLLALLDRILTTSRAVLCLVEQGFCDQAFGLSRTVVEAFFSLRYIQNKDSEARAKRYLDYFAKDREHLLKMIGKHHPNLSNIRSSDHEQLEMANQFKSPHSWFPEDKKLKDVAFEDSTWAFDEAGEPENQKYSYDIIYKLTSHEVHSTSVALEPRIADFSTCSRLPTAFKFCTSQPLSAGDNAVVNACNHSHHALVCVFHAFGFEIPSAVQTAFNEWELAAIG